MFSLDPSALPTRLSARVGVRWELPGGRGAWKPGSRPRFLSQSPPVDGHSGRTGALHALFPTAARRQFSSGAARAPARLAPSRPRPRLGPRSAAGIGGDRSATIRKGRRERPAPQNDARGSCDSWSALGQGARAPSPALRPRATIPNPPYQELPRPVAARDGGDVSGVDRDDRKVGDRDDERRRRGPTSPGCAESSRPTLRRRGQSRGQDDGAGRVRGKRSDRSDAGPRGLEAVGTDGGADPQGAVAAAADAGGGLVRPASREGAAPESRLDGGFNRREGVVFSRDVQGRGSLRCVLANAALGTGVHKGTVVGRDRSLRVGDGEAPWTAVALRLGSGTLLHGPGLPPEAAKARCEAEVRGNREEGLDRADRAFVEDAEGHARPAPAAAVGGARSDGEDRDGPRPLRPLPPASGARRCDAGRDLLRPDARASLSDPASPWQAGRSPNGSAVSHRVPRRGAASAGTGSKSSLKSAQEGQRSTLKGVDVYAPGRRTPANPSSLRANAHRNTHCAPAPRWNFWTALDVTRRPYRLHRTPKATHAGNDRMREGEGAGPNR